MQRTSAVRTIDIIHADQALALRTAGAEFVAAPGAEVESGLHATAALRAGVTQRLSQKEIKNDAQSVGNNDSHDCPKCRTHPAAFCVAVDIADKEQETPPTYTGQ